MRVLRVANIAGHVRGGGGRDGGREVGVIVSVYQVEVVGVLRVIRV